MDYNHFVRIFGDVCLIAFGIYAFIGAFRKPSRHRRGYYSDGGIWISGDNSNASGGDSHHDHGGDCGGHGGDFGGGDFGGGDCGGGH